MSPTVNSDIVNGNGKAVGEREFPVRNFRDAPEAALSNGGASIPVSHQTSPPALPASNQPANHVVPVPATALDAKLLAQLQEKLRTDSTASQISFSSNSSAGFRPSDASKRERCVSENESVATSVSDGGEDGWSVEKETAAPPANLTPEPPDGGWGWMIVLGTILAGALIPSLFICFGVLMNDLLDIFPDSNKSTASWIPSIMNSLMNIMGPITSALISIYSVKSVSFVGGLVLSSGLVLSFFTNSIAQLYFTYGLLGGIGAGLSLAPGYYLISQYFKKRRGLATGICMSGSSLGQIALPHIIRWFLDLYGYRGCILVLGGITLNICVSASLFRSLEDNNRQPPVTSGAAKSSRARSTSLSSRRSSFTFIPDEAIYVGVKGGKGNKNTSGLAKNGDRKSSRSTKARPRKSKKSRANSNKAGGGSGVGGGGGGVKKAKRPSANSIEKDVHLAAMERIWQNAKKAEAETPSPPRSRSRTLSLDSCRILPGIPEEHEEHEEEKPEKLEPEVAEVDATANADVATYIDDEETSPEPDERQPMLSDDDRPKAVIVIGSNNNNSYVTPSTDRDADVGNGGHLETGDVMAVKTRAPDNDCKLELGGVDVRAPEMAEDDPCAEQLRRNSLLQRQCSDTAVSLHHHFCGSVASVASLGGAGAPGAVKRGPLDIVTHFYRSMAFGTFFRLGMFHILTASFSLMIVTLANFSMFVPPYGMTIGLTRDESAGLISFIAVASMCGRLLMPALSDWLYNSKKHLYSGCCLLTSAAILMTAFANDYTLLLVSLVLFGFASGGSIAISINVFLDYIPLQLFTAFYGLVQFVLGIVILFATPMMGLMADKTGSFVPTFLTLACGSVISASILYLDRFVKPISPTITISS